MTSDEMARDEGLKAHEVAGSESGLHKRLGRRQLVMIGLGGAIGTGLFMGSGLAIGYAGPAVAISYAIAGIAAVAVVFSLSEMAVMHPTAGSLGIYAEIYLNPWAGVLARYSYWIAQVIAVGAEAIAAGVYMNFWFLDTPVWIWSVSFAFLLIYMNSRSVSSFASIESALALIKVTAIIVFIAIGVSMICGIGMKPIGFSNLTRLPGGFAPHGLSGLWMAVIIGVFSFNGIEVIAVTSGEAEDPVRAIPAALRTMAVRLMLFYVLALTIIVTIIPWTETGALTVTQSPFVRVFANTGIRHATGIMNFVALSAALSSMNTNVYLCSRMLFSLSRGGYAPRRFGELSGNGSPEAAILCSGALILLASAAAALTPRGYSYLLGIALFNAIIVWIIILLSHFSFRRRHKNTRLPVRTPWFPMIQVMGLVLLCAVLLTMGFDRESWQSSWFVGVPWVGLVTLGYFIFANRAKRRSKLC
jgi:AAT family amino acid transporter